MARKQKGVRFEERTLELLSEVTNFARTVTGVHVTETALMERFIADGMASYMDNLVHLAKIDEDWRKRYFDTHGEDFLKSSQTLAGDCMAYSYDFFLRDHRGDKEAIEEAQRDEALYRRGVL